MGTARVFSLVPPRTDCGSAPRSISAPSAKTSALYYKLEKYGIGTIEGRERGEKGGAIPDEPASEEMLGDGPEAGGSKAR